MPNLTHSFESAPVATVPAPKPPCPAEGSHGLGHVFELLLIPLIVVGYHVAITFLRLLGHRDK
jgi:hypothetical protein